MTEVRKRGMKFFQIEYLLITLFLLIAGCSGGNGNSSSALPPNAPSNLQATVVSSAQTNLAWTDNSHNEDEFKIERKTGVDGTYYQVGTVGSGITNFPDPGLACGNNYYYQVRADNSAGDSDYSNEAGVATAVCPVTVPAAPSDLTTTFTSPSQINLSWTDNSDNEDGFKIERKTGTGGTYSLTVTTSVNTTSYSDTGLSVSTTYSYRVYAYNPTGNSSYSNEINSTTTPSGGTTGQMVSIPAGCFKMGDAFKEGNSDERPVHNVCISAFQIGSYEVTNTQYRACVDAGVCAAPESNFSFTRSSYYGNSTYDNYPVIYVDWGQAKAFCQWLGGRLPTEAEWEYAARGGLSGKKYPWGNDDPTCTLGATNGSQSDSCSPDDTIRAGSFAPNGYGLYDLAGNVSEWVNDWYDSGYYSRSQKNDPPGPSSGTYRVLRGGSWNDLTSFLRVAPRSNLNPMILNDLDGFRCAK